MPDKIVTTKCCWCIGFPCAILTMLIFTVLSLIGCVLNILNTLNFISTYGLGGVVMCVIVAIGQICAAYCYVKFIQVYWPYNSNKGDHSDADRNGLVDAFKYLIYAAAAMYLSNAIAVLIFSIVWGKGDFGISYGISTLISMIISVCISFIMLSWWRNSFKNHALESNGAGPVDFSMVAIKEAFTETKASAAADADKAKQDAATAKDSATAAVAQPAAAAVDAPPAAPADGGQ